MATQTWIGNAGSYLVPYTTEEKETNCKTRRKKHTKHKGRLKEKTLAINGTLDLGKLFSDFVDRYGAEIERRTAAETRLEMLKNASLTNDKYPIEADFSEVEL